MEPLYLSLSFLLLAPWALFLALCFCSLEGVPGKCSVAFGATSSSGGGGADDVPVPSPCHAGLPPRVAAGRISGCCPSLSPLCNVPRAMTAVLTWSGDIGKVCSHFELFSLWLPSLKVVPVSSPSPSTFWQCLAAAPGPMSTSAVGPWEPVQRSHIPITGLSHPHPSLLAVVILWLPCLYSRWQQCWQWVCFESQSTRKEDAEPHC